jgi:site-specific DNA recombinase
MKMDKKGRPRPDGYKMEIEPKEAAVILRIFTSYAEGMPLTQIVKTFNEENVPGSIRSAKGWSRATISRILDNEKYAGRWIWNRTESRRDPKTGRRRRFNKPESEWVINEDEELRIIPKQLWQTVRERRKQMHRTWPGGNGNRGFSNDQGSRQAHFPTHLLAGSMVRGSCGATIAQVSSKSGGYYGCLAATKGACDNKTLVRRTLAEKVILGAVQEQIADPEHIAYVLKRVEEEIAKLRSDLPDTLKVKEAELTAEQCRLANFVDFIGEGRGSQALAKALVETERRVDQLADEVDAMRRSRGRMFSPPPIEWIKDRLSNLQQTLEQRTARSAQVLRSLLGPIRLDLVTPDIGRPFYRTVTTLDALALIEEPPPAGAEGGSNSLQRWRRRELNPRPQSRERWRLRA